MLEPLIYPPQKTPNFHLSILILLVTLGDACGAGSSWWCWWWWTSPSSPQNWEDEHSFFPGAVTLFLQSVCQTETDLSSQIKTDHLSAAAPGFKIGLSWREKGAQPIAHVRLHTWVISDMIILSERVCPDAELTSGIPILKKNIYIYI